METNTITITGTYPVDFITNVKPLLVARGFSQAEGQSDADFVGQCAQMALEKWVQDLKVEYISSQVAVTAQAISDELSPVVDNKTQVTVQ